MLLQGSSSANAVNEQKAKIATNNNIKNLFSYNLSVCSVLRISNVIPIHQVFFIEF